MLIAFLARSGAPAPLREDFGARWDDLVRRLREGGTEACRVAPHAVAALADGFPREIRRQVYEDLVAEHLKLSWECGTGYRLDDYPGLLPTEDLLEDEFLARCRLPWGDLPSPEEYGRRFPGLAPAPDRLARRLLGGGRYVILARLAWGATAEVWDAVDRRGRLRVVVKRARPGIPDPEDFRRRLEREARLGVRLTHPGIVGFHDYAAAAREGGPFLVMPAFEGSSLAALIAEYHGSAPGTDRRRDLWGRLLRAFAEVCDAVEYAHRQGVFHRDLKPANVLVGPDGRAMVVDWGLAAEGDPPVGTELAGTPEYMAPEQLEGFFGPRSDVFALGALLHEIVTGVHPRPWKGARRPPDWMRRVREGERREAAPRGEPPARALLSISRRAMDRDPAGRPATAGDLGREVRRAVGGGAPAAYARARSRRRGLWSLGPAFPSRRADGERREDGS